MKRSSFYLAALVPTLTAVFAACSATSGGAVFGDTEGAGGGGVGSTEATTLSGTGDQGAGGVNFTTGEGVGTGGPTCTADPAIDNDGDGWTGSQGDCNDCDPNTNPGAIEVINTEPSEDGGVVTADEDCDDQVDELEEACDANIALDDGTPMNAAKAIDLCQEATPGDKKWGVLSAAYVRADGSAVGSSLQNGILDGFGSNVNVQVGERLLALSSGHARTASQPGACGSLTCSGFGAGSAPAGFPQDVPNCAGATDINDDVGLEVHLRAPTNATGYSYKFDFYSFEYPEWVCTSYNDQYIALVNPAPAGSVNGNISFDSQSNPVSVNIAFFDVCSGCALGTSELQGTGFDVWNDAGATSWLQTQAPVTGGQEFTIRFAIWDTGDDAWDSTVLVDGFQWIANGGTVSVGTDPIPDPR
jgi:hypothetical protein